MPQNLLQELRLLVFLVAAVVVSLLTVTLQISVDVDTVDGGRSDGVEALPPEQSPPVVLVCIQDDDAALTSMTLSDGFNKFWGKKDSFSPHDHPVIYPNQHNEIRAAPSNDIDGGMGEVGGDRVA